MQNKGRKLHRLHNVHDKVRHATVNMLLRKCVCHVTKPCAFPQRGMTWPWSYWRLCRDTRYEQVRRRGFLLESGSGKTPSSVSEQCSPLSRAVLQSPCNGESPTCIMADLTSKGRLMRSWPVLHGISTVEDRPGLCSSLPQQNVRLQSAGSPVDRLVLSWQPEVESPPQAGSSAPRSHPLVP